jgi:hypothetical protein
MAISNEIEFENGICASLARDASKIDLQETQNNGIR